MHSVLRCSVNDVDPSILFHSGQDLERNDPDRHEILAVCYASVWAPAAKFEGYK